MVTLYPFDTILLEPEHKKLLITLVEADRSIPRGKRAKLKVWTTHGTNDVSTDVDHPGLGRTGSLQVFQGDIDALAREGLLDPTRESDDLVEYTITARGYAYYRYLIEQTAAPTQRMEESVRRYLDADHFRQQYAAAYQKWAGAEVLLWGDDSNEQLSTIGHLCREAIQEFATVLVTRFQPLDASPDTAKTVSRLRAVITQRKQQFGEKEHDFLDALVHYWGTLSDLIQLVEHAGQKQGRPISWDDARRVVLQTMNVMFEVDGSLSRTHGELQGSGS